MSENIFLESSFLTAVIAKKRSESNGLSTEAEIFAERATEISKKLVQLGINPEQYLQDVIDAISAYLEN